MPLKLAITRGADKFEVDGDFTIDAELNTAIRVWLASTSDDSEAQAEIDALSDQLGQSTEGLHTKVQESSASPPGPSPTT